jgi:hypothetical protein
MGEFPCTKGTYETKGEIKFFDIENTLYLGGGWTADPNTEPEKGLWPVGGPGAPPSGKLPWTREKPDFWDNGSEVEGTANRNVEVKWNCCPDKKKNTELHVTASNSGK